MRRGKNMMAKFVLMAVLVPALSGLHAEEFSISAALDKNTVGKNQQFRIIVEMSGGTVMNAVEPELPSLDEFAAYVGRSSSTNIQVVNSRFTSTKTITFSYVARDTGTYEIPPIVVNYKGETYKTRPLKIQVIPAAVTPAQPGRRSQRPTPRTNDSLEDNIYLRAIPSKKKVYQGEAVILTYKLYTRLQVTNYGFRNQPHYGDFWVEDIPMRRQPRTTDEIIDGVRYTTAILKRIALFPTSAGRKTIPAQDMEVSVRVRDRRTRRSVFDTFFDDPFFGRTVNHMLTSNAVDIEVMPLPRQGKPADFSGAVGRYDISMSVDKAQVKANEALTLRLVLSGEGNIKTLPAPEIPFPDRFEVYEPKINEKITRSASGISGSKTFEYVLIPRSAGTFTIDPVSFSFFDPEVGTYRRVSTSAVDITVLKGDRNALSAAGSGLSKRDVELIGRDIRFIARTADPFQPIGRRVYHDALFWLLLVAPLLVAGYGMYYRATQEKLGSNIAYARSRKAGKVARRQLQQAHKLMQQGDVPGFYAELARALTHFVGNKLNLLEGSLVREDIAAEMRARQVAGEHIEAFETILSECDFRRFAVSEAPEDAMQEAYEKVKTLITELEKEL